MKRLLIVQYSGDFRAAWHLRAETGGETYYGHGYILDQLGHLATRHGEAGFLCCLAPPHRERLPNGATVMGAGTRPGLRPGPVIAAMEAFDPTHLIVHGPMPRLIRWGVARGIPVGCVFADSFHVHPLMRRLRYGWLARQLNDPSVSLVANHGVNAARGLVDMGVAPSKVLAWDFPHRRTPAMFAPKLKASPGPARLLYVGSIEAKKGVGDLIAALGHLPDARLSIAGGGQVERFRALAEKLGVAARVAFLGLVPNAEVPALMHDADVVVVPSRHAFPEGLPLTLYEALASRTPVVASDHPMFAGHLVDGESAMVFPAGNAQALADRISALLADPKLYARVSAASEGAWQRMQVPVKWGDMIDRWVNDEAQDRAWLAANSLAAAGQGGTSDAG